MLLAPPCCLQIEILIHTLLQASRVEPSPAWKDWSCWGFLGLQLHRNSSCDVDSSHWGSPHVPYEEHWPDELLGPPRRQWQTQLPYRTGLWCTRVALTSHTWETWRTTASGFCPIQLFSYLKGKAWENWTMLFILCPSHHS